MTQSTLLKRFFGGLVAGIGFAIGVLAVGATALGLWASRAPHGAISLGESVPSIAMPKDYTPNFHELPIEEQIKQSSAIVVARFEPMGDGGQKAIITDVLKQAPGTVFYYKVGDEYPDGRQYSRGTDFRSDGLIVFFQGSPASMRMSMTYSGDRIRSLGDMPMALFRQKCGAT